jgi:DNA-binding response OmpR family regulator
MARILVADDDRHVREALDAVLKASGHEVVLAFDGRDALDQAAKFLPDVVLLDIEMPQATGFDVLAHLKADPRLKDIPVIMVTGRGANADMTGSVKLGARDYIQKPWKAGEVEMSVKWALRATGKLPPEPQRQPPWYQP